jgi:hypothetical protein
MRRKHLLPKQQQKAGEVAIMEPYRVAAAVVAEGLPAPKYLVQIGAFQGQFLSVFLDRFPNARGQWTEGEDRAMPIAKQRLAQFGDRVSFVIGCPLRDISAGCVPKETDVIISEWVSIHQSLDGMYKIYRAAAGQLPPGGWLVILDHVSFGGTGWESQLQAAAKGFRTEAEGPAIHHADYRVPTADEQVGAMRAAGFDVQVVWQSFNTVLFMGCKR